MTIRDILKGLVGLIIGIIGCALAIVAAVLILPIWVLAKCGGALIEYAGWIIDSILCGQHEENSEATPT